MHFCRLSLNVRPMLIASPTVFICVVSVGSACGMVAVRQHLEGKARNFGDDVINARLEARRSFAGDVVLEFVEQMVAVCKHPAASVAAIQLQRSCVIEPSVDAQRLRWVNGQNENNVRCIGGERTSKDAKYANKNWVLIFAWFVWFAVESGGYKDLAPDGAFGRSSTFMSLQRASSRARWKYSARVGGRELKRRERRAPPMMSPRRGLGNWVTWVARKNSLLTELSD